MPSYLRVALSQIHAHPAYCDASVNFLMEPTGEDIGISKLASIPSIKSLRKTIYDRYLSHIKIKVEEIIDKCIEKNVNLLIFPEYSIPPSLFHLIQTTAVESNICIVAGSHLITTNYASQYQEAGLNELLVTTHDKLVVNPEYIRQAVCPIFLPDRNVKLVFKRQRSQWESNLVRSNAPWDWIQVNIDSVSFNIGVKLCIDALNEPDLPKTTSDNPKLLVIPSWSPKTSYFESPAKMYLHQEIPVLYVNEAGTGQTKVYGWCHRENSDPFIGKDGTIEIPKDEEALVVADIDLNGQFGKQSTVCEHEPLRVLSVVPLVYLTNPNVSAATEILRPASIHTLKLERCSELSRVEGLPELLKYKLTHLSELLEAGTARKEDIEFLTEVICMPSGEEPLLWLQYTFLKSLQKHLAAVVPTSSGIDAVGVLTKVLPKIKEAEKLGAGNSVSSTVLVEPEKTSDWLNVGNRPYLGRDEVINTFRRFSNDTHARLCMVFGMRGLGKSSFLIDAINQVLPPTYARVKVQMTEGSGFNRFVLSLFHQLRLPLDEKVLEDMSQEDVDSLMQELFNKFDSLPMSCMIIDDWQFTRSRQSYHDWRFECFLGHVMSRSTFHNNKVIITSQIRFAPPGEAVTMVLNPLDDDSICSIINWHIRTTRVDGTPVEIPFELVRRLHGNPLAATIVSQLLEKFSVEALLENTQVQDRFQNRLIPLLIDQIALSEDEQELASYLSVYNVPFEFEVIERFCGEKTVDLIEALTDYFLLYFDIETGFYLMHPLVREYFLKNTPHESRVGFHHLAAEYYTRKVSLPNSTPTDKGEHISQLAHSLQFEVVDELRTVYSDELRPVALRLFKERKMDQALKYYTVLDNLYPGDLDIKFHIGLCFAHLESWADAERFIPEAMKLNEDAWWVLAGYGDVLAKKRRFGPAEKYLHQALEIMEHVSVIRWRYSAVYQSLALIYEKDWRQAEAYYRMAIKYDETSAFARYAYAKFLWKEGDAEAALEQLFVAEKLDGSFKASKPLKEKILEALGQGSSVGETADEIDYEPEDDDYEKTEYEIEFNEYEHYEELYGFGTRH